MIVIPILVRTKNAQDLLASFLLITVLTFGSLLFIIVIAPNEFDSLLTEGTQHGEGHDVVWGLMAFLALIILYMRLRRVKELSPEVRASLESETKDIK